MKLWQCMKLGMLWTIAAYIWGALWLLFFVPMLWIHGTMVFLALIIPSNKETE